MARLGTSSARSLGRRLRSVAVIGLIVGAAGAFIPGGHSAHAAAMDTCVSPASIMGTIGVTVGGIQIPGTSNFTTLSGSLTGGTLTVKADGANVTLDGTTPAGLATGSGFTQVCSASFPAFASTLGDAPVSGSLSFATPSTVIGGITVPSVSGTCDYSQVSTISLQVLNTYGDDSLAVDCTTTSGQNVQITFIASANGTGPRTTPTPELGSGELLATGLVPALGIVLYRRRRQRRTGK